MGITLKIETDRPAMVTSYLNGILQQMKLCKHFFLNDWKIKQEFELGEKINNIIPVKNLKTAEATKLFENISRDVNFALANEFALLCEKIGIDFIEALEAANTQPYSHLLLPGIVGGRITKDPYLLIEEAENVNVNLRMTILARKINDGMLRHTLSLVRKALRRCSRTFRRSKVSVFGVSSRPNIKEAEGSLTKELVDMLHKRGVRVRVYDPFFTPSELKEMGYPVGSTLTKTVQGVDCLIIAVGHDKFKKLNLKRIKFQVRKPAAIVDMSRVINPARAEKEGFMYFGVGRGI